METAQANAGAGCRVAQNVAVALRTNHDACRGWVDHGAVEASGRHCGNKRCGIRDSLGAQDVGLVGLRREWTGQRHGPVAHYYDGIARDSNVIEDVRRDQHADVEVARHATDDVEHFGTLRGIEAIGRLIENNQVGRVDESLCQFDALAHSERETTDHPRALLLKTDREKYFRRSPDCVGARESTQLCEMPAEIGGRQFGGQALMFGGIANAPPHLFAVVASIVPEDVDLAGVQAHEPKDRLHQRRLASAVLAQQSGGRRADGQRHVVERLDAAIPATRASNFDRCRLLHGLRVGAIVDTAQVELTATALVPYLVERGVVPASNDCIVSALGGGISNDVWCVEWDTGCLVVKQALPFLRVAEVWAYDVGRSAVEHRCLSTINRLLGPGVAPSVVFTDDNNHTFGMTCAPPGGTPWKELLLATQLDLRDGCRAGDLLGRIHTASASDSQAAVDFDDVQTMVEGRIDPYHRSVAVRHPDLAELIDAEIERLLATRSALVLGDYAPKNLIAYPDRMLVLDVEVAHWGDPVFDVAFCLNHLCLKALYMPRQRVLFAALARGFYGAYREQAEALIDESATICELGILMVARVDGKSPAEYLDERSQTLARALGRSLLLRPPTTVLQAIERVEVGAP